MMQGFNTGNAWSTYTSAAGKGQKMFAEGLESLGKAYAERVKDAEKKRIQGIKEADKFETDQAKSAYIYAVQQGDKTVANNILSKRPDLMAFAGEANEFYDPGKEQLKKAQSAYIAAVKSDNKEAQTEILKRNPGLVDGFVKNVQEANSFGQPKKITPYQTKNLAIENKKLELRRLENKQRALDRALAKETNILKQKQIEQAIEDNKIKSGQLKVKLAQSDLNLKESVKAAEEAEQEKTQKLQSGIFDLSIKMDDVNALLNNDSYLDKLEGYTGMLPAITTESREAEAYFNNIKDSLTLENLEKMSGTLTDKDISVLSSAASALQIGMGKDKIIHELKKIYNVLDRRRVDFKTRYKGLKTRQKQQGASGSGGVTNQIEQPEIAKTPRQQALEWLRDNPDDPNVPAVKAKLGI